MTTARRRKARKVPPPTVVAFRFSDGSTWEQPSAEALVTAIEKNAIALKAARADVGNKDNASSIAALEAARLRYREQVQSLLDAAIQLEQTRAKAGNAGAQAASELGAKTRRHFDEAVDRVMAKGVAPAAVTVTAILDEWPTSSPPGVSRTSELLAHWKKTQRDSGDAATVSGEEPAHRPTVRSDDEP